MRIFLSALVLFTFFQGLSQEVIPLVDFSGYFKSFKNGFFRQIEFQQIRGYKAGDDLVALGEGAAQPGRDNIHGDISLFQLFGR